MLTGEGAIFEVVEAEFALHLLMDQLGPTAGSSPRRRWCRCLTPPGLRRTLSRRRIGPAYQ